MKPDLSTGTSRSPTQACDVLVVDDDRAIRDAVIDVLRDEGLAISCAGNGAVALAMLRDGLAPSTIQTKRGQEPMGQTRERATLARASAPFVVGQRRGLSVNQPKPALDKAPTGIVGLDQATSGGLPRKGTNVVMVGPGAGKDASGAGVPGARQMPAPIRKRPHRF